MLGHRRISDRPRDDRGDTTAQWSNVTFAVGMHAVAEKHDEHLARRIDPDRRAGETSVSKRAERKQLAAIGGVTAVDVPAQTASVTGI